MCAYHRILGIAVEGVEDIEDTVYAEGDANTRDAWHAEDAREVVVAATASDRADLHVEGLHLEDGTCIVVQATGEGEVELDLVVEDCGSTAVYWT